MSDIKPIETEYNGYKFRSRLEARWAVFFDACGIKYEYEPEGYEMDGVRYLPDFRLLDISNMEGDLFVEIKGKLNEKDIVKLKSFIIKENTLLLLRNIPPCESWPSFLDDIEKNYEEDNGIRYFSFMSGCHGVMAFLAINDDGKPFIVKDNFDLVAINWEKTLSAYKKARSARFEFDQAQKIEEKSNNCVSKNPLKDYIRDEYKQYSVDKISKEDNVFSISENELSFSAEGWNSSMGSDFFPKPYHVFPLEGHAHGYYRVNIPENAFEHSGLVLSGYMRGKVAAAAVNHFIKTGKKECNQEKFINLFLRAQVEYCAIEYYGPGDNLLIPGTLIQFPFGIRTVNKASAFYLCRKRRMVIAWKYNYERVMELINTHTNENGEFDSISFLIEANQILPEPLRTIICSDNEYEIEKALSDEKYKMTKANKTRCVVRL